jgi:Holliday junction resolvase RusA-like endonuclease
MAEKAYIELFIKGIPKAQPRARRSKYGGVYNPSSADDWKTILNLALREVPYRNIFNPVSISLLFFFPRPQRLMRKKDPDGPIRHISKPDADNLEKAVYDVITAVGIWQDDKQVCVSHTEKWYVGKEEFPGCKILIEEL